jgi:hypothetical protein
MSPLKPVGARQWRRCLAAGLPAFFLAATALTVTASPVSAEGTVLYAYVGGHAVLPASCPQTTTASKQCTLGEALFLAVAGGTVDLATPGSARHYVGNWTVRTSITSSAAPVTIEPAPGVTNPVLDGNHGKATGCATDFCNGPVLTIYSDVHVHLDGLTVQNADNTADNYGGAIQNNGGGTLTVSACTFSGNSARNGGAIDNADNHGSGMLNVSGSTFSGNSATGDKKGTGDGGAIDNADNGGHGTISLSASRFSGNSATGTVSGTGDGGAIDNADNGATGTISVSASRFSGNSATGAKRDTGGGGAIDNGDNSGTGTLSASASTFSANRANYGGAIANGTGSGTVSASTFSGNLAGYGGAIASGDSGIGALSVSGSTFSENSASSNGGAIDNGDGNSFRGTVGVSFRGDLSVSASTFSSNSATGTNRAPGVIVLAHTGDGGAIDNGDNAGTGTLTVTASTFSANLAEKHGGTVANFLTVWASADIFSGSCSESAGGIWNDAGYNVGSDATCLSAGTGDVSHGADRLGPLARNGGPTETMSPLGTNPAVGAVPYNTVAVLNGRPLTLCPATDQRGARTAAGQRCNAGAVQSRAAAK